jgi:UDP-N-acetylmuramate dehydrogenase
LKYKSRIRSDILYLCLLKAHMPMQISHHQELQAYNSFKIKARAETFIEFESDEDFAIIAEKPDMFKHPLYVLGGGYNTLFRANYQGTILKISNKGFKILEDNNTFRRLEVGAGEDWNNLVQYALQNELHGLENLIDIPGNVGAAPIQNIGAYGAELADVVHAIKVVHLKDGHEELFLKDQCAFSYRNSIFKRELRGLVLIKSVILDLPKKAELKLSYGAIANTLKEMEIADPSIQDVAQAVSKIRASKLPDPEKIGNAGSFFKNPIISRERFEKILKKYPNIVHYTMASGQEKLAAGWMIDQAGWKGKKLGEAAVHDKQALVLINYRSKATGADIEALALAIIQDIYEKYGVVLEAEVNFIG